MAFIAWEDNRYSAPQCNPSTYLYLWGRDGGILQVWRKVTGQRASGTTSNEREERRPQRMNGNSWQHSQHVYTNVSCCGVMDVEEVHKRLLPSMQVGNLG